MVTPVKSNQQHIFLHDALCEGPIEGLVYGDASVYLNGNRLKDIDSDAPLPTINGKVSCSSSTFTTQYGLSIPIAYNGTPKNTNYLVVRKGTIARDTTTTTTYNSTSRTFTIATDSSLPATYTTGTDENRLIALVDKDSNAVLMLGQGSVNTTTSLKFTPLTSPVMYEIARVSGTDYYIQLIESLEISNINSTNNTITTTSAPTLGNTSGTDYYTFYISGAIQPDPEDIDEDNPAKISSAKVQFRNGSTFQDPIIELNGVGGGVSYTGNPTGIGGGGPNLKQLNVATYNQSAAAWEDIYPNQTPYSTSHYPEGESIINEGASVPSTITSNDFNLSGTTVKTIDELRIQISYNAFYAIDKNDGKEYNNNAAYLFQIRFKRPGATSFEQVWRNAFNDGSTGSGVGQIYHSGKHKSAISFEHFIDLTPFKPFDDFQVRVARLTRHKGRAIDTNRGDAQEGREQGDATSTISVLTAINKDKFSYPYTAHAGVFLDSREFSSVPKRSYELKGLKVRVPKGYLPREYSNATGTGGTPIPTYPEFWDGTMSDSLFYTDNPAWIFYDIIVNDRFGAGEWVKESDIDLYALYRVSKYCDELVDDGKEGYEPRFRANLFLTKATDVYKVLKDMATIFTSLVYWMDGKMTTVLDAPGDPIYQFTKGNVIDGMFSYETVGQKTRANQIVVTWNDPALNYEQSALVIEDRAAIIEQGRIIKEEAFAFGCTSEGQARRYGKWKLWTAKAQTEVVNFSTSFEGLFVKPGDIIQIQDSDRYGTKLSGRIKSVQNITGGTEIELDRSISLNSSNTYELALLITESAAYSLEPNQIEIENDANNENGGIYTKGDRITHAWIGDDPTDSNTGRTMSVIDSKEKAANAYTDSTGGELISLNWNEHSYVKTINIDESSGNFTTLTTEDQLSTLPNTGSVWMLTETVSGTPTVGSPDLYKILNISQEQSNIYSITAVEWSLDKYDYVDDPESVIDISDDVYSTEPEVVAAPTQIRILQNSTGTKPNEELIVEWDYPAIVTVNGDDLESNRFLDSFEVLTNIPENDEVVSVNNRARRYAFNEVPDGTYVFRVRAVSVRGNKSAWTTARYIVDDPFSDNVNRDKGLQLEGLASQFPFITNESGSSGGNFRGDFDSTLGTYGVGNEDGYKTGDIVLSSGQYRYLPSDGSATDITTWSEYRGGILKFRYDVNAVLAPSRFRRSDAISFVSNFAFDVNIIRSDSDSWIGIENSNNVRKAQVLLDHSTGSLRLIHARFDEALNMFYWYDLHEAMNEDNTTEILKYWKNLPDRSTGISGTIYLPEGSNKVVGTNTKFNDLNNLNKLYFSSTFGARVSYVESDTVLYLDRKAPSTFAAGSVIYVQKYAPDFRRDVIIGRVSVPNSGRGNFTFENFLTLDPNLEGKRSVLLDPNVAFLQYDSDENLVFAPDTISIQATAFGFDEPVFKVTYGDPSTAPLDENDSPTIFEPEQTSFQNPNFGIYAYDFTVWDGVDSIPYDGGASFTIKVEVVEKEDQGNSDKGVSQSIIIPKVGDVAAASAGRSVFMELEDYSIIYNSGGAKPIYNGQPNYSSNPNATGNILFSATASPGFGEPIFRWKVDGTAIVPDPTNYPNATWYEAGGGGDLATYDWPVPATLGNATDGFNWTNINGGSKSVTVEVAEKPDGWTATVPTSGANTNEVTDDDIFAKDVDNILAIRVNAGGLGINFVNDSHIIPCDAEGNVLSSANSGGSIEVFLGGQGVDFTTSTPNPGEFTIGSITSTETDKITVGGITATSQSNGPIIATIADHTFTGTLDDTSTAGFETQEAITYPLTIYPHDGGDAITTTVTQAFTLVKNGAQAGTGVIYLYATGATASDLTTIDSSFPHVRVTMASGTINQTTPSEYGSTVFQDGDYGYYTSANGASTVGQPGDVLWVIGATANSNGADDFILYDEWSSPVQFTGTDGVNSRVLELFGSSATTSNGVPTHPGLDMSDITYTFENGNLSYTTLGSWSETMPSPSRSAPYVWRTTAAALSNLATATIDGKDSASDTSTDWSTPVLINRFIEDGITLELTNDAETVGAATSSTELNNLNITTTAKVFQAGSDISSHWSFAANADTGITVSTSGNTFTVTDLSSGFQSGNVSITATADNPGTYAGAASRTVNFTVTKVANGQDGVSYRITPSEAAVSYNPNSDPVSWSPTSVTFTASKITPSGSTSFTSGYWKLNGSEEGQASSIGSGTINYTSGNITVQLYLDSNYTQLVDTESVPIIPQGTAGDPGADAKALFLTSDAQIFKKAANNTITPSSITFTANTQNLGSSPTINFSSNPSVTLTGSGNTTRSLTSSNFGSNTSVTVTATTTVDNVTYTDSETIELLQDGATGADAITVSLTNDNHTFTANSNGAVSTYTGSGTDIAVYEGATKLSYDGTGTSNGTWTVSESASGITAGGITDLGDDAQYAAASGMTGSTASITFNVTGKTASGDSFTASKVQTFSIAEAGDTGPEGISATFSGLATYVYDGSLYDVANSSVSVNVSGLTNISYSNWSVNSGWSISSSNSNSQTLTGTQNRTSAQVDALVAVGATVTVLVSGTDSNGNTVTNRSFSGKIPVAKQAIDGDGVPGKRSVQAYIYYQSESGTAPTVPSPLSNTFTVNFNTGAITSSDSDWSTTAPVMTAGNANKYWYFNFIATEAGTYNNGYPSTNMNSSPSPGSDAVQSLGFTGLVTFASNTASLVSVSDGSQTISFGSQGTTKIDGGNISTGTIQADRISLSASQVGALDDQTTASQIGGQTATGTTAQIQAQAVTIANKYSQITASGLGVYTTSQTYQTTQTYSTDQADTNFRTSDQVTAAIQAQAPGLAPVQSVNGLTGDVTGIGGDDLSATDISAGKIVLTSGTLKFTDSTNTAQYQPSNSIVLDTTSGSNSIRIYDGTTERVRLGKL